MSKKEKDSSGNQWFLRTGADAEFGPVEKQGLLLWAEQARILPGHEVSSDRKSWKAAVSVDFLDMCWFIDDGDGELKGPLNQKAAETLIKSGKFSAKARIVSADEAAVADKSESELAEPAPGPAGKSVEKPVAQAVAEPADKQVGKPAEKIADKPLDNKAVKPAAKVKSQTGKSAVDSTTDHNALKTLRQESGRTITELNAKIKSLEAQLRQANVELKKVDASSVSSEQHQSLKKESVSIRRELGVALKRVDALTDDLQARDNRIEQLERKLNDKNVALNDSERKIQESVQIRERALQQARESERSFARLLSDANKRDVEYKAQIEALKKNISLSPDQTDRFYNDQNAIFQILKRELETMTRTMEGEREYMDSLKKLEMERLKELEKRRQTLQNHMGNSPSEMTSRVLREQTSDPNAVRLRSELDNLKLAHERSTRRYEERERDMNHKLKVLQADYTKLMAQMLKKEQDSERLIQLNEKLKSSEHELSEIRRSYEAERRQFVANNNALTARVVELEGGAVKGVSREEAQAAEAKGVKLASWMSFKK